MPSDTLLLTFVAASLLLLLIPGPGVVYVVAHSLSQGYRAGLLSAVGLSTGVLVHVAATTAGLSAILQTSATAFNVVKLAGAAYLIYLGIRALLAPSATDGVTPAAPISPRRLVVDGVIVSVLNPKIALFFIAFLPQFVEPDRAPVTQQILFLGLLYAGLALVTDSCYACLAGSTRRWLGGRTWRGPLPKYLSGGLYIGLGISAALTGRRHG